MATAKSIAGGDMASSPLSIRSTNFPCRRWSRIKSRVLFCSVVCKKRNLTRCHAGTKGGSRFLLRAHPRHHVRHVLLPDERSSPQKETRQSGELIQKTGFPLGRLVFLFVRSSLARKVGGLPNPAEIWSATDILFSAIFRAWQPPRSRPIIYSSIGCKSYVPE